MRTTNEVIRCVAGGLAVVALIVAAGLIGSPLASAALIQYDHPENKDTANPYRTDTFTTGSLFTVGGSNITITHLGGLDVVDAGAGYTSGFVGGSLHVGLWQYPSGTLLGELDILSTDPLGPHGDYRYRALPAPVVLQANAQYMLGAYAGAAEPAPQGPWSTTLPQPFSGEHPGITTDVGAYHVPYPNWGMPNTGTIGNLNFGSANAAYISEPPSLALTSVEEGFNPGNGAWSPMNVTAVTSVDTGYAWSGYQTGWGLALLDAAVEGQVLDMSGVNVGYDNWNAWTVFGGDSVTDLQTVSFSWGAVSTSGNLLAEALIQDANGDWFVSDDVVADTAGSTCSIDATTTTWRTSSAPVIGTPLTIGAAGTPDLSQVKGGGFHTVGVGVGGQTRLDTLTFTGVPEPSSLVLAAFGAIGLVCCGRRRKK